MQLDLSTDYTVLDNLESVVLRSRRNAGDWQETPLTAKRRKVNYKEMQSSNGVYITQDRVWLLPAVLVDTGPVKSRDQIVDDDGIAWTVLEAELQCLRSLWRCVSRNLIIANDLQDLITIETPTISYDAAGGALKTWNPKTVGSQTYQALPCRVQPISFEITEERGLRGLKGTHIIPVAQDLVVTNDDRVNFGGVFYEITGYHSPQSIEDLFVIDALLLP